MICNFDLFLQHGDALGEIVMPANLPRQLFQFGVGHGLRDLKLVRDGGLCAAGRDNSHDDAAQQAEAPASSGGWGASQPSSWQSQTPMVMQLDPTAMLVMRAMIFAARADGSVDALERQRIDTILQNMLQSQDVSAHINALETEMLDPRRIAADVQHAEQGEDIYRLSCVVIDIDHFMERSYLDALGTALGISPSRRAELEADAAQGRHQLEAAAQA